MKVGHKKTKIIMDMAISIDGYVADRRNNVPWTEPIWSKYYEFVRRCGCLIVGRKTYNLMSSEEGELEKLGKSIVIVLSRKPRKDLDRIKFVKTPEKALQLCKQLGCSEIVLGGGTKCNEAFLKKNLVDEIILDIEPIILGNGIPLFETVKPTHVRLVETKLLSLRGHVRLHYELGKYKGKV